MDTLTSYATLLGRAVACGVDILPATKRVGAWMDRTFPPGSPDQKVALIVMTEGMKYHAEQQRAGRSPDSCETVRREFGLVRWP